MFTNLIKAARNAEQVYRQRQKLARLSDELLRDIGLTSQDAQHEAARPIWDAPGPWTRKKPLVAVGARPPATLLN